MKNRLAVLALLCASMCHAAPTVISDTIRYPDATLANGSVTISWPAFVTLAGTPIAAGSIRSTITSGVLLVSLEPNITAVPSGTSYSASFSLARGSYTQRWIVPVSGPVTIGTIVTSTVPTPALTIALSQISTTGCAKGGILAMSTSWGCLLVGTNGYVLTADSTQTRGVKWTAAAAGGGGIWGTFTGTLSDQLDLGTALAAKLAKSSNLSDLTDATAARTNLGLGTAALSATGDFEVPITFTTPLSRAANAISIPVASASANGYLSSTDWSTFNAKQAALGFTAVPNTRSISTTSPLGGGGDFSANRTFTCTTCVTSAAAMTSNTVPKGAGSQGLVASGCTIDVSDAMTCAGGFSTGAGSSGSIALSGSTSGTATIVAPAIAGTPTLTLPIVSGTFLTTASAAAAIPAHATNHQSGGTDEVGTTTPASGAIPKAGTDSRIAGAFVPWIAPETGLALDGGTPYVSFNSNVGATRTDLYTSPASTRTLIGDCSVYNPAGSTSVITWSLKDTGAAYWRFGGTTSVTTLGTNVKNLNFVLEPTESLAATPTVASVNIWCKITRYASTNALYSARLFSLSTGQNTLYTVPVGKIGVPLATNSASGTSSGGILSAINDSGGSRTYTPYIVPLAGSPGTTNQLSTGVVATNGGAATVPTLGSLPNLSAGDFISVNVDAGTATQWMFVTVMER